jgi:hypothetical protein
MCLIQPCLTQSRFKKAREINPILAFKHSDFHWTSSHIFALCQFQDGTESNVQVKAKLFDPVTPSQTTRERFWLNTNLFPENPLTGSPIFTTGNTDDIFCLQ